MGEDFLRRRLFQIFEVDDDEVSFADWAICDFIPFREEAADLVDGLFVFFLVDGRSFDFGEAEQFWVDVRIFRLYFKGKSELCTILEEWFFMWKVICALPERTRAAVSFALSLKAILAISSCHFLSISAANFFVTRTSGAFPFLNPGRLTCFLPV